MANLQQIVVQWTGFSGAPGYSVFHGHMESTKITPKVFNFFNTIKPQLPSTVKIQIPALGNVIDDATGDVVDVWTDTASALITGGAGGKYHAAAGACVTWGTGTFLHGRRLRGRTFLVPLESGCFAPDGSLDDATRVLLLAAASTLVADSDENFVVWHRPTSSHGSDGSNAIVVSASIRDRGAILTSRRTA